ncbi:MAG: voltage-gated chloride channel family protein [Verrucomicrobiota bacterium]
MTPAQTGGIVDLKINFSLFRSYLKLGMILGLISFVVGSSCALFLWSLDRVTSLRELHPELLFGLPLAGFIVGFIYYHIGKKVEGGNHLILDQIHEPGGGVPRRMAPMILIGTVVTHLFGGSAGREGTAVQMGGSIASAFAAFWKMNSQELQILLMAGIAAGFGGVFGTPWAGAIFAIEVLWIGRIHYRAFLPCLLASLIGNESCQLWGVGHLRYPMHFSSTGGIGFLSFFHLEGVLWLKVALAGIIFGLGSLFFAEVLHLFQSGFKKVISYPPFRPVAGGIIIILLVGLLGTSDYLGLGVSSPDPRAVTILSFFTSPVIHEWSWLWKIIFTAVTLGAGFKGGEVTPLFFIGAAMGNLLSAWMGAPSDLFAAIGFVAIFAGAANTPLACTIMGIELFGWDYGIYLATACFIAFRCSGHSGIYLSQRVVRSKRFFAVVPKGMSLREWREINPHFFQRARLFWKRKR